MNDQRGRVYVFGPYRLDVGQRTLWRGAEILPLTPKEFETLLILVENGGQVVGKDAVVSRVWPDTFVGDSSLTRNISVLRKTLGDGVIQTAPKFGYRLMLPVQMVETGSPDDDSAAPASLGDPRIGHMPNSGMDAPPTADAHIAKSAMYAPPSRMRRFLPWVAGGLAIALALALGDYLHSHEAREHSIGAAGPVRIAVLPFLNLTGNPSQEYLCDGLTEAMIAELSRVDPGRLDVIVRASDAGHVWSGDFERNSRDLVEAQQEVAIAIAEQIDVSLARAAQVRLRASRPVDPEAYRDYLLGRFYWSKRNRQGLLQSVTYFKLAIGRDPAYARAYAGLAQSYLVLGGGYMPDRETYAEGRQAALKALELDPELAEAYTSLAYEKFVNEWDWKGADEDYQRAIALDPNDALAHHWYAIYLAAMLRSSEAMREVRRALALDPLSLAVNYNAGWIYMQAGRDEEAIGQLRKALEIDPGSAVAHGGLAAAYERKGAFTQALDEWQAAQRLSGTYSPYAIERARLYAVMGEKVKARNDLVRLRADPRWGSSSPLAFATAYAAFREKDRAFRWLRKSVDDRSCTATEINTDPRLDPLRSDPRFVSIRRQYHLPVWPDTSSERPPARSAR